MKEEKKERIKQLVKKLAEFSDEQRELIAQKFGIRNPEGHLLSGRNMMLLYLQAEDKPLINCGRFPAVEKIQPLC